MAKIFITAALTGAVHVPSLSPYLPVTEQQIIDDAISAAEAGAAVVHVHARNPENGAPSVDPAVYERILTGIKARSNVIICVTTGGGAGMSPEERLAGVGQFKPEVASCNAGSFNFFMADLAKNKNMKNPKYDWEVPFLLNTENNIFHNTFRSMRIFTKTMAANGTLPEFEAYELGMINNIAYLKREGSVTGPIYIQFVLGIMGGLPASVDNLVFMKKTADDLLGKDGYVWSCAAAGRAQFPVVSAALAMGGNARVGLEDNLYLRPGVLAKNSGEQVAAIRQVAEIMGHEIGTPDDARALLSLKGISNVGF